MTNEGKLFRVLDWDATSNEIKSEAIWVQGPVWYSDSEYIKGVLVEFLRSDGSRWLVKFGMGVEGTSKVKIFEYPDRGRIIVINQGYMHIVTPDENKIESLNPHLASRDLIYDAGRIVTSDDTSVYIVEPNGDVWVSPRISWDGFEDLVIENNVVKGLAYTPVDSRQEWWPFTIHLETKEITGGTYTKDSENTDLAKWEAKIV